MSDTPAYIRTSDDGRYGLTGPDDLGYHSLYRIVAPDPTDPEAVDFSVGLVADPANFGTAIDAADEEMACLIADARAEFG
ncbi:MAG TPA: hypothetical protein VMW08_00790 [Acidimicrobiales bacterium]|nr:hypothetical protein [Acidimicrobiales bacterium]